jgi:hypothetical protein
VALWEREEVLIDFVTDSDAVLLLTGLGERVNTDCDAVADRDALRGLRERPCRGLAARRGGRL